MAHNVSLSLKKEELTEVKYFIAGDEDEATDDVIEPMTVIAFRITPNARNKFDKYSNAYRQENDDNEERYERRYVSVEVRDPDEFQVRLAQINLCICVQASDWERGLAAFPLEQQQFFGTDNVGLCSGTSCPVIVCPPLLDENLASKDSCFHCSKSKPSNSK